VRADALGFFYLMRSGGRSWTTLRPDGRPAGHAGLPPNRGDVAVPAWAGDEARRLYPRWRCRAHSTFRVAGNDAGDRTRRPGVILTTYAPSEGWHWGSNGRILNNLVVLAVAQLVSIAGTHLWFGSLVT
jgi:hypothetical protein